MKTFAFAASLLLGGAAFAQADTYVTSPTAYDGDGLATLAYETDVTPAGAYAASDLAAATPGAVVEPSNAAPERDARGIAVISAAAVVPPGWNGTAAGEAMGGPELDSVTGEAVAPESYPACTRTVTDKCLQTYERGRH
jgi:hypothetical protein